MLAWLGRLLVLVLACTASCASPRVPVVSVERMPVEPESSRESPTRAVLRRIAHYRSWPRQEGVRKSAAHHGLWLAVHFNALAASAANDGAFREGTIIVAENRAEPDGPPVTLTTMAKRADGWHWIEHAPDGTVHQAGELDVCVQCHREAAPDMVFFRSNDERCNERDPQDGMDPSAGLLSGFENSGSNADEQARLPNAATRERASDEGAE